MLIPSFRLECDTPCLSNDKFRRIMNMKIDSPTRSL